METEFTACEIRNLPRVWPVIAPVKLTICCTFTNRTKYSFCSPAEMSFGGGIMFLLAVILFKNFQTFLGYGNIAQSSDPMASSSVGDCGMRWLRWLMGRPSTRHPVASCRMRLTVCWVFADESQVPKFLGSATGVWTQAFSAAGRHSTTRPLIFYFLILVLTKDKPFVVE